MTLPDRDRLTLRWLIDRVPIRLWFWWIGILIAAFTLGFAVSEWYGSRQLLEFERSLSKIKDDRFQLEQEIAHLEIVLVKLRADEEVSKKSDDELDELVYGPKNKERTRGQSR